MQLLYRIVGNAKGTYLLLLLMLFSACRQVNQDPTAVALTTPSKTAVVEASHTPSLTPTHEPTETTTPSVTPTPAPTATPTATAVPINISGDPRSKMLGTPVPSGNAPCGVVDLFDFPLDPPHGQNASGGSDFGRWRNRYEKYHAGEDWRMSNGNNFAAPVFSIGHGLVTYADPDGWGRDKGVVIIRHTLADGDSVLSFYGHLDPPSVTLKPGLCVTRGEQIGQIGKPRTSPHLHFEIRTHLPYQTGTGYWPEDPRLEGWLPPSQTIWHNRLSNAPGVQWDYMEGSGDIRIIGVVGQQMLIISEGDNIRGLDISSADTYWSYPLPADSETTAVDSSSGVLYSATQFGTLAAYSLPGAQALDPAISESEELALDWSIDLDLVGRPTLIPLHGGGLVLFIGDQMAAISEQGDLLWIQDDLGHLFNWTLTGDQLLITSQESGGSLVTVGADSAVTWPDKLSGIIAAKNDQLLLYNNDGIFGLDQASMTSRLLLELPGIRTDQAGMLILAGGDILLSHWDAQDRRLIRIDSQGKIVWQRSIAAEMNGSTTFFELDGQPYLVEQQAQGDAIDITIYAVDLAQGDLLKILSGGTRSPSNDALDILPLNNKRVLINIKGQNILSFDPQSAIAEIGQ